jgi:hypothetical protein
MLDNNHTTEIYSRTLRTTEPYLTVEGPYRGKNGAPTLAAIAVVICLLAVSVWGYL